MALAGPRSPGWWVLIIVGLIELGLGFWAAGSWRISAVLLVAWVAAGARVHGVNEIVLAFQVEDIRGGAAAVEASAGNHSRHEIAHADSCLHTSVRRGRR